MNFVFGDKAISLETVPTDDNDGDNIGTPQTLQYQYIIASEHLNVLCNTILCFTDACTVQNIETG